MGKKRDPGIVRAELAEKLAKMDRARARLKDPSIKRLEALARGLRDENLTEQAESVDAIADSRVESALGD